MWIYFVNGVIKNGGKKVNISVYIMVENNNNNNNNNSAILLTI